MLYMQLVSVALQDSVAMLPRICGCLLDPFSVYPPPSSIFGHGLLYLGLSSGLDRINLVLPSPLILKNFWCNNYYSRPKFALNVFGSGIQSLG